MLDTIIYIPTILAYAFITLLVVILCFIVIYVSHKLYISIYDNLPVVTTSIFNEDQQQQHQQQHKEGGGRGGGGGYGKHAVGAEKTPLEHVILAKNDSSNLHYRKSKTGYLNGLRKALRIIVTLEPCYLAYVIFESLTPQRVQQRQQQSDDYIVATSLLSRLAEDRELQLILYSDKFIRYYDRLSAIPPSRCRQAKNVTLATTTTPSNRHPVLSVLDAVVQKALTPRSTVN